MNSKSHSVNSTLYLINLRKTKSNDTNLHLKASPFKAGMKSFESLRAIKVQGRASMSGGVG